MLFLTLAAYLHRIDPFALEFMPGVGIRWYGLSYVAGFLAGYLLLRWLTRRVHTTLQPPLVSDLIFWMALGVVVGGRLGYVLFYDPSLLWTFSRGLPYWDALAIHQGGMASHGGMIGAIVAAGLYARKRGHAWGHLLDMAALGTPLGLGMGRLANFINGELYGRPCAADFPLAVQFPSEMYHWPEHKLQAFAQLTGLRLHEDISLVQVMHLLHKGDASMLSAMQKLLTPRHPSQLYQALAEGVILFLVLMIPAYKPRKPWLLGGLFMLTYGILRIFTELFREPDAHLGYQLLGLTRGQWLSLGLVAVGLVGTGFAMKSKAAPMGGWGLKTRA